MVVSHLCGVLTLQKFFGWRSKSLESSPYEINDFFGVNGFVNTWRGLYFDSMTQSYFTPKDFSRISMYLEFPNMIKKSIICSTRQWGKFALFLMKFKQFGMIFDELKEKNLAR